MTMLRYNVDKPESSYDEVQIFAKKKEDENFQQVFYVNYKLEEFIGLLDVMNSVYDKVITYQHISNLSQKTNFLFTLYHIFSIRVKMS